MKRFLQYIEEKRTDIMHARMPDMPPKMITGVLNPTPNELIGFTKKTRFQEVRFIVAENGKALYAWDADSPVLHQFVIAGEQLEPKTFITGTFMWNADDPPGHWYIEIHWGIPDAGDRAIATKNRTISSIKKLKGTEWEVR